MKKREIANKKEEKKKQSQNETETKAENHVINIIVQILRWQSGE